MVKKMFAILLFAYVSSSLAVNGGTITSIGLFQGYNGKTYIQVNHSTSAPNLPARAPGTPYVYSPDPSSNAWSICFIEWSENDPAKNAVAWSTLQKALNVPSLHLEIEGVVKVGNDQLLPGPNTSGFVILERWRISN